MRKLYITQGARVSPEKSLIAGDFINFCADNLSINGDFEIFIVDDRDAHNISTTAAYHRGDNVIKVYGKNRALVDILRSVAHELTHLMQDESGSLVGKIQDAGGPIENEANAKAGEIIKLYAKSMPERRRIYERKTIKKTLLFHS
jgi:Zn-dependent peptidase ImmA (M78 family)